MPGCKCARRAIIQTFYTTGNPTNKMKKMGPCAAAAALFTCVSMSALAHTADIERAHAQPSGASIDYKNAIYRLAGKDVTLLEGQHAQPVAEGSAEQDVTRVVEPPAHAVGKLGGRAAVAVFLSEDGGGSGTFYYVALVFNDGRGTTFQIGDRIQPTGIAINGDDLIVSYLDRKTDEPMAVPPTVPRERHFAYMNGQILERPQAAAAK